MLKENLLRSAGEMGIAVTREQAEQFETYHRMLTEANARFNLTRVPDDIEEAVHRNYLDSASLLLTEEASTAKTIADVGSGAGFPGIPLSILRPDCHVVLMDALDKRVGFLSEVIRALGLNAEAVHIRAEIAGRMPEYRERFDCATARAVAALPLLSEYLLPLVKVGGAMAVLMGPGAAKEIEDTANAFALLGGSDARLIETAIPGRDWKHCAVAVKKTAATPEKYPRRPGIPEKRPL